MANKLDEFMAEIKAFDYKWFDEIGGNEALAEIRQLREQASGTTTLAVDVAMPSARCGCLAYEGTGKLCGYCNRPPRH